MGIEQEDAWSRRRWGVPGALSGPPGSTAAPSGHKYSVRGDVYGALPAPWSEEGPTLRRDTQPALAAVSYDSHYGLLSWPLSGPCACRRSSVPTLTAHAAVAPTSLEARSEVAGGTQACAVASDAVFVLEPLIAARTQDGPSLVLGLPSLLLVSE